MTIKETIGWLKIMRADLKNFPEISNGMFDRIEIKMPKKDGEIRIK